MEGLPFPPPPHPGLSKVIHAYGPNGIKHHVIAMIAVREGKGQLCGFLPLVPLSIFFVDCGLLVIIIIVHDASSLFTTTVMVTLILLTTKIVLTLIGLGAYVSFKNGCLVAILDQRPGAAVEPKRQTRNCLLRMQDCLQF